jgi:hypothetical protein
MLSLSLPFGYLPHSTSVIDFFVVRLFLLSFFRARAGEFV